MKDDNMMEWKNLCERRSRRQKSGVR